MFFPCKTDTHLNGIRIALQQNRLRAQVIGSMQESSTVAFVKLRHLTA